MSDTGDTITITGNVATAPELKRTPGGVSITTFRVASGQRRFDRGTGEWSDAGTNWYTVSVFRKLADHAFHSLQRGDRVILTGKLRLREWDNGTKRGTAIEIDADAIGHDLRWGTTTFVKDAQSGGSTAAGTSAEGGDRAADAWAVPGTGDGLGSADRASAAEPGGAALVGATAGHDDADAGIPF
ncbi:single-stranded DNA-binding protein [Microbacterium hibisci]|uniref:single-stranded DNA-binding protein n=1 Tax=Microbacterium hibisci TaxID=2036000 RepID=UPI0019447052|nr:single-stranded DNA-binding protein [Microbacterium hibisci]